MPESKPVFSVYIYIIDYVYTVCVYIYIVWQHLQAGRGENVFVDCSSSYQRSEFAQDVTTCITPEHNVYAASLKRYLLPIEMLGVQGVWRIDSPNKEAFDRMANNDKLAQDLAGNGFPSTVAQAMFLSALASSSSWTQMDAAPQGGTSAIVRQETEEKQPELQLANFDEQSQARGKKRALVQHDGDLSDQPAVPCKGEQPLVPCRRIRGKQSPSLLSFQPKKGVKKGRGFGGVGNKVAKGKKQMCTIAEKTAIFKKFEDVKARDGSKAALEAVSKMPGYFAGCMFKSKWGEARIAQKWDLLTMTAPALCAKHKELPNSLRLMLNMKALKWAPDGFKGKQRAFLPQVFQQVVESMTMERIELGEEVSMVYVKNLILYLADVWNDSIASIRSLLETKGLDFLKERDQELANMSPKEVEQACKKMLDQATEIMRPIHLTETDGAVLQLVRKLSSFNLYTCTYTNASRPADNIHLEHTYHPARRLWAFAD